MPKWQPSRPRSSPTDSTASGTTPSGPRRSPRHHESLKQFRALTSANGVKLRVESEGRAPSEDLSGYRVVRRGDLVVNRLWARFGAYGVSPVDGIISPAYWVFRVSRTDFQPAYLHHLLRSKPLLAEIGRRSKNMPPNGFDLPWEQFRTMRLTAPPLDQQRRIADFLNAEMERMSATSRRLRDQVELVAERRVTTLSDALAPPSRSGPVRGPYPWLAHQPHPIVKLGWVTRLQSGATVDGSRPASGNRLYPYLRVANVQERHVDLSEVKEITLPHDVARRSMLRTGDVLMTEGGDLDKLGRGTVWDGQITNCLHQNHVFALRPDPEALLPRYLSLMTRTHHARCYFESTGNRTTNLASTNSTKILAFRLPLPPISVQASILRVQEREDERQLAFTAKREGQLALLEERRQALVTAAIMGQLDVTTPGRAV